MKTLLSLSLLALLFHAAHSQPKEPSSTGRHPDEAAIEKVITGSHASFDARDLNAFAAYFVKSADLYYQVYTADRQLLIAHGWEAMTHMVEGYMKEHPQPDKSNNSYSNLQIRISGNTAWINYRSRAPVMASDFLVLEKKAGQWKIAALASQQYQDGQLMVIK